MPKSSPKHIAIVGGGFSGLMTAVNLARLSRRPLQVTVINCRCPAGRGVAHGTRRPEHLLNVAARNMSAFRDEPDHFLRWLRTRSEFDTLPEIELRERFIPRMVYGDYLRSIKHHHLQSADGLTPIKTEFVAGEVLDIQPAGDTAVIRLANSTTLEANRVVLATGNEPPAPLPGSETLVGHPASFGPAKTVGANRRTHSNDSDAGSWWLLRLGNDPKVRRGCLPATRVFLFGFLVRHCRHDDHIFAVLPVHWSGDLVGSGELNRIEDPQNFVKVAAGAHRVNEHQLDLLVRADQEDRAHRGIVRRRATLGRGSRIARQHIIELCDLEFRVADQRVVHSVALSLFYVRCPFSVTAYRVHAQPDNLAVSLREFGLQPGHVAEFGGANGSKVFRV